MELKQFPYLMILWMMAIPLNAQTVTIPDPFFKASLVNHDPLIDTNHDGEIQLSEATAFSGTINVSSQEQIVDLTGIEAFINLDGLACDFNQIGSLDLAGNPAIHMVSASGNPITSINITNNPQLEFLQVNNANLTTINTHENPLLHFLYASGCGLTQLDLTNNPLLEILILDNNNLETLNLSNNIQLYGLFCRNNRFTHLNLSNNPEMWQLDLKGNDLLTYINLKSGNNQNLNIDNGTYSSNFEDLPLLDTVCLDDVNSDLAAFILSETGHSVTFTEDCSLNIKEKVANEVRIFPNPAHNILNISTKSVIQQIEILNLLGQFIQKQEGNAAQITCSVSNLSQGLYFLKVTLENKQTVVFRFLKE